MELDITPDPTEEERAAIEAALRDDEAPRPSPWADALLPQREAEADP